MYLVLTFATRKCLYGGQGTGQIILLNLTDLVLLMLDCLPDARKPAAAARIGVATGSAAAEALANALRTDKTIEDMRAGEAARSGLSGGTAPAPPTPTPSPTPTPPPPPLPQQMPELIARMARLEHSQLVFHCTHQLELQTKMQEMAKAFQTFQGQQQEVLQIAQMLQAQQAQQAQQAIMQSQAPPAPPPTPPFSPFKQWWVNNVQEDSSSTIVFKDLIVAVRRSRLYATKNMTKTFLLGLVDFELGLKWNRTGPSNEWQLPGFKIVYVFD